jgi:hypothetical protein
VVTARAVAHRRLHLLDVVAVAYFVALLGVLLVVRPDDATSWGDIAQAGSHAVLTIVVLASVAIGHPSRPRPIPPRLPTNAIPPRCNRTAPAKEHQRGPLSGECHET